MEKGKGKEKIGDKGGIRKGEGKGEEGRGGVRTFGACLLIF